MKTFCLIYAALAAFAIWADVMHPVPYETLTGRHPRVAEGRGERPARPLLTEAEKAKREEAAKRRQDEQAKRDRVRKLARKAPRK